MSKEFSVQYCCATSSHLLAPLVLGFCWVCLGLFYPLPHSQMLQFLHVHVREGWSLSQGFSVGTERLARVFAGGGKDVLLVP